MGVGLLSAIVATLIVIAMESASLGATLLGIVGGQVDKWLMKKAEKHKKICMLAEAKFNMNNKHISKALKVNSVPEDKYSLIITELNICR